MAMVVARITALGAVLLGGVSGQSDPPVQLHGSGTTNPSKFFWEAMDLFEERAKIPLFMTYRGVGSGTGQTEFVGETNPAGAFIPYGDFGSGDIPMSQANYDKLLTAGGNMVHIPFAVGPVGIFHGLPLLATGGVPIKLTVCLLARIFSRSVTTWDHADIKALNPKINVPAGTNIVVGRRSDGSSSTAGTTQLFQKRCPDWTLGSGATLPTWPAGMTALEGSGNMVNFVKNTQYSIGYMEAGHGQAVNLPEIALTNAAGNTLTSKMAVVGAAADQALAASAIPIDPSATWSAVNLYDLPGNNTWPITLFSYFYVRKNLSAMSTRRAGVLKAFIQYSLTEEGQSQLVTQGFAKLPAALLTYNVVTLRDFITWPVGMPTFTFETAAVTQVGTGFGEYAISSKRRSNTEVTTEIFRQQITELQGTVAGLVARPEAVVLHGSGTTNPSKLFWETMDLFEERAKFPMHMTYRAIGSGSGQTEFVGASNPDGPFTPFNHFGSGDIPMSKANFGSLPSPMVHIPFAVGPVGIFHNVPPSATGGVPIKLTVCLLARIFSRSVTTWDHADIKALNPKLTVPAGTNISVARRSDGSSSTAGTTQLFQKRCPEWTLGAGATLLTWPADTNAVEGSGGMSGFIQTNKFAIGYIEAGHGHAAKLREVSLTNAAGKSLTTKDADLGAAALQVTLPVDASADWSDVNMYDLPGDTTWPITLFSYFYVMKDLSTMQPKTAALLKSFIEFILGADGQAMMEKNAFAPLPAAIQSTSKSTLESIAWPAAMVPFTFETMATTRVGAGAGDAVISSKRRSNIEVVVSDLQSKTDSIMQSMATVTPVVELHGSGTTNPSLYFWQVMDFFKDRIRRPLLMSYRAVGSGAGQAEFVGEQNPAGPFKPYNHFGSGDIPMSKANFDKLAAPMVHIPFAIGPVGIFHGVPASATGGADIILPVCLLAKIFARAVTTWDHADIKALNPNLKVPAGTPISVGRRKDGSSSTTAISELFKNRCPEWTLGSGSSLATWPADTTAVEGSGGMTGFVLKTQYSIGYVEAGQGHDVALPEIAVTNAAGKSLTTLTADIAATAAVGLAAVPSIIPGPSADWSGVNLYDLPGDTTWPITLFSYFYVQKDLSNMHFETCSLLQTFILFAWSDEGKALLKKSGFTPLPQSLVDYNLASMKTITWPAGCRAYTIETAATTQAGVGAELYTLSAKRRSFGEYERSLYSLKIAALEAQVTSLLTAHSAIPMVTAVDEKEKEKEAEPIAVAAIVLAGVAILFSATSVCMQCRRSRYICWDRSLAAKNDPAGCSVGNPQM